MNNAAANLFNSTREELLTQNFRELLSRTSLKIFLDVIEQLNSSSAVRQHIWIPAGLHATRTDGHEFPLEFRIKADVPDEQLEELCQLGPTYSPVFDSLTRGVPVEVSLEK